MIRPPALQKNDTVGILSTARNISAAEIQPAIEWLSTLGLKVKLGKSIGLKHHQFAGTDAQRAADFQQMLDDPDIKAIWCARGGYGTVRIIDRLDFSTFKKHSKWIVGYSDVTVLHNHLHVLGYESLHAQMAQGIDEKSEAARTSLKKALFGESISYAMPFSIKNRKGEAQGEIIGGNLSILYSLLGSPSSVSTKGKILFLEDLDEYLYHIDRMMQNLKRNGYFEQLSGLVVGGMSDMRDNTKAFGFSADRPFGKTAEEIILETVAPYDFPVCFDFPAGHIHDNRTLILGREMALEVTVNRANLSYL